MTIPTLDLHDFASNRDAFVADLGAAYRRYGFVGVRNHGLDPALVENAYRVFQAFFALPEATKQRYHLPGKGGARGYTGFKIETAKDSEHPDLKEFWHVGRELPSGHAYANEMPDNLWPSEIEGFREYGYGLYQALDDLGRTMLQAIALVLELPQHWFDDKVDQGNSILRPIHYPPIADPDTPSVRAGQHEDINLITLLIGSSAEGLQLLQRDGSWLPVTTQGDAIVCNIGDMLQRLTNHVLPSTTHRVVNPAGEKARQPRYSIPFFLHPNPDFVIETLPNCITPDNPNRYLEPITAQGYLEQRLREIRLI
jgi:isopenicillin N synthase-like dioxygenase